MISKELIAILVCPETKQPLQLAQPAELAEINNRIRGLAIERRGGGKLEVELTGALLREDGKYAYPIHDGIPVMLIEESFEMPQLS